jgi:bacillithiol system protein YtxJ
MFGLFGSRGTSLNWQKIENDNDIETIWQNSLQNPAVLFKHSTRCSISSMALSRFERDWKKDTCAELWFLDLIAYRELSNQIAQKSGVKHESPQVIVVHHGKVIYHASHYDIRVEAILRKIETE